MDLFNFALPKTNKSPLKAMGPLETKSFPFGALGLFSGAFAVSFREGGLFFVLRLDDFPCL